MNALVKTELAKLLHTNHRSYLMDSTFRYQKNQKSITYRSLLVTGSLNTMDKDRCSQAASIIVDELSASDGIQDFGSRQAAKAELWSGQLCRGLGPVGKGHLDGPWWFDAQLVRRWERVYMAEISSKRRDKVMEAIRPMLAICKEWNDLLRLVTMTPGGTGLPVVTGQGRPKPPSEKEHAKWKVADPRNRGAEVLFIGGFQQVFVPFVPSAMVGPFV